MPALGLTSMSTNLNQKNGGESVNTSLHRVSETQPVEPQGDPIAIAKGVAAFIAIAALSVAASTVITSWLIPIIERASR